MGFCQGEERGDLPMRGKGKGGVHVDCPVELSILGPSLHASDT